MRAPLLTCCSAVEWIGPIPDARVMSTEADPADAAVTRDSVRLALVSALQNLPPRQRAVTLT